MHQLPPSDSRGAGHSPLLQTPAFLSSDPRLQPSFFKADHTPNLLQGPCPGLYSLKAFFHLSLGLGKLSGPMGSLRFRARGHLLSSLPLPGRKEESESEGEGLGNYKLGTAQR